MAALQLTTIRVEKPWGRETLWPGFGNPDGARIGEIWFDAPAGSDPELMVKYLFTSERLSIQVHPDDDSARADGIARGKDEAWVILDAEPDATIALGTVRPVSREELRAAALDGSIETLVDWKPVTTGQVIYSPAGTVHAIGPGLTAIEVQQNLDLTYRLYDYGRPRPLHLDKGIAVSNPVPFVLAEGKRALTPGRTILCEGGKFVLERWREIGPSAITMPQGVPGWLIPVTGGGTIDGARFSAGECWLVEHEALLTIAENADILFAYPGSDIADLFR